MSNWKYFTEDELKCKHTGIYGMDSEFMEILEKVREEVGIPFIITSAYRDPTHPIEAKKSQPGAHASGRAVDILINNAGILDCGNVSFEKLQIDDLSRSIAVNTLGPMKITQLLLPKLSESASPRVFHMTSQMGSIADNRSGGYYFYRISKAALNMFNKSFSQDYPNIPSIVIHPGWVRTDMGGDHAPISPDIAAINISDLILTANNLSSGNFYNYKGEILPW